MDIVLVIVCGCCAVVGMFWGAVRMASTTLAVVGAVLAGKWAGPPAAALLAGGGEAGTGARIAGVLIVAVLTAALILLAGRGMRKGLETLKLGWLDRLAGGAVAGAIAVVLCTLLLALAAAGGYLPESPWARRLALFGQAVLELHSQPASNASPSSTPPTPTSSGQQPR